MRMTMKAMAIGAISLAFPACHLPIVECEKYIECVEHYDAVNGRPETLFVEENFGEGGPCYANGEIYERCETECDAANIELKQALEADGLDLGPCE